jgi:hypothetical protein
MFKERLWTAFRPPRATRGGPRSKATNAEFKPVGVIAQERRRAQQAILAALVNHRDLRDEFAEALGAVAFDPDLDKLRQRLQNLFTAHIDLDLEGVRTHFSQSGDARLLDGVLDSQVYAMAPFAGPKAGTEEARQGLGHLLLRRGHERLKREVAQIGRMAANSDRPEDEARALAGNLDAVENDRRLLEIDERADNRP